MVSRFYFSFLFAFALYCSAEFVDIVAYQQHVFPEDVRDLGIPTTLLHYHPHAQGYLVYSPSYTTSRYVSDLDGFYPCSWYLGSNGSMVAYEYCEEKHEYNEDNIMDWLLQINDTGYGYYGTTARKIDRNVYETSTALGHIYKKRSGVIQKRRTETGINTGGRTLDSDDDDDGHPIWECEAKYGYYVSNVYGHENQESLRARHLVAFEELVTGLKSVPVFS